MKTQNEQTWNKVEAIALHIIGENDGNPPAPGNHRTGDAIAAATAYLLGMERTKSHHHIEDSPLTVAWADHEGPMTASELKAQQEAWTAVWDAINKDGSDSGELRYQAMWDVIGVIVDQNEMVPGMGQE